MSDPQRPRRPSSGILPGCLGLLLALIVLAAGLPAQDPPELPPIPKDPHAAVDAMPVHAPVADGHVVRVRDGDSGADIEGADVLVLGLHGDDAAWIERMEAIGLAIDEALGSDAPAELRGLAAAAVCGVRYRTEADGTVAVDLGGGEAMFFVRHEGRLRRATAIEGGEVVFYAPQWLAVRVERHDGTPAVGVPVGLGVEEPRRFGRRLSMRYETFSRTDAAGQCRFNVAPDVFRYDADSEDDRRLVAVAEIASFLPIRAEVDVDDLPERPVVLRLPPCGRVRFILYGDDEKPAGRLSHASLRFSSEPNRSSDWVRSSSREDDNCTFDWVEIGRAVEVQATIDGMSRPITFSGEGPTRAGELVIVDGRLTVGPPILAVRVLDATGAPVADELVGHLLRRESETDPHPLRPATRMVGATYGATRTDAEGWLEIPTQEGIHQELYLTRRVESEATTYLGGARLDIGELHPGRCELGDVRFAEETVVVRRQLVDETGEPAAGAWLRGKATCASEPRGAMAGGGGSSPHDRWFFEHHVQTDENGWFELREFAPVAGEFLFQVEGRDHASPGGLWISPHSKGPLRVYRTSTITARLDIDGLSHPQCEAKLVHRETGAELHSQFRDGVLGPIRWAAGTYDIEVGEDIHFVIENVEAPAKGQVSDPRLDPVALGDRARWVEVEVVDDAGAPVADEVLWHMVYAADGSGAGAGYRTDADGKATLLVAGPGAPNVARQELGAQRPGFGKGEVLDPDADKIRVVAPRKRL